MFCFPPLIIVLLHQRVFSQCVNSKILKISLFFKSSIKLRYVINSIFLNKPSPYYHWRVVKELVRGDFSLRYQHSCLGYFWTLVKPLLLFGVMYLVFAIFMPSPAPNYPVYLLLGILIWNFFSESTLVGMNVLLEKRNLITKLNFSRISLVIASTFSSLITFLLNFGIFLFFLLMSGLAPGLEMLFFPVYLLEMFILSTGITLILAVARVHFRDVQHIWEIFLQLGFWLTPIVYSVLLIPEQYHRLVFLNPWARLIEYSRDLFIHHHIPSFHLNLVLFIMCVAVSLFGYWVFQKQQWKIAEKL